MAGVGPATSRLIAGRGDRAASSPVLTPPSLEPVRGTGSADHSREATPAAGRDMSAVVRGVSPETPNAISRRISPVTKGHVSLAGRDDNKKGLRGDVPQKA